MTMKKKRQTSKKRKPGWRIFGNYFSAPDIIGPCYAADHFIVPVESKVSLFTSKMSSLSDMDWNATVRPNTEFDKIATAEWDVRSISIDLGEIPRSLCSEEPRSINLWTLSLRTLQILMNSKSTYQDRYFYRHMRFFLKMFCREHRESIHIY